MKLREELQLKGHLPTTPEGALRSEVVDPTTQDAQRFPGLERQAILADGTGGWSVPEHVKRKVIEQNAEVLFERRVVLKTVVGSDGKEHTVEVPLPPDRAAQQRASNILLLADQRQHERDNPEQAGRARGGSQVNVTIDNSAKIGILQRLLAEAEAPGQGSDRDGEAGGTGDPGQLPSPEGGGGGSGGVGKEPG